MKRKMLVKTIWIEINQHLGSFIMTVLMLGISFALLFIEVAVYAEFLCRMLGNQSVLSVSDSQLYRVDYEYYKLFVGKDCEMINQLFQTLNDEEAGIHAGFYYTASLNAEDDMLCLSKELLPIGKLTDIEGNTIVLDIPDSVIVGYELRKAYPVGSTVTDMETGKEYQVTQVLAKGSRWLPSAAFQGMYTPFDLDHMFLMDASAHIKANGYIQIINGANNSYLYHPAMTEEEVDQYIQEKASQTGVRIYPTASLDTMMKSQLALTYKNDIVKLLFVIICFLLSLLAQYLVVVIHMEYRKCFIGILLANGWRRTDINRMESMECGLRLILGMAIALTISYLVVVHIMEWMAVIQSFYLTLPFVMIGAVFLHVGYHSLIVRRIKTEEVISLLKRGN